MTDRELLEKMFEKIVNIEEKVNKIEERMDRLEERMDRLEERMDQLEERMDRLEERVDTMERDVSDVKVTLENEIRTNIIRIVDGHLDLSRNLHSAMKPSNEVEMLAIKVSTLETEINKIKKKIS